MRRRASTVCAFTLGLAVATPGLAAPLPVARDEITVSGRFDLPRASALPLKGGLKLGDVSLKDAAGVFMTKPEAMRVTFAGATEASLRNFGYLADTDTGDAVYVNVKMETPEVVADAQGVTVTTRLTFNPADDSLACLPRTAEAKFHALTPEKTRDGQRAGAVLAVVAFAAIGYNAGQFATAQFSQAKAEEDAVNARRVVAEGQAVAPTANKAEQTRFAAIRSTQLAFVNYLGKLSTACLPAVAPAPAEPAPPTAKPPAASEVIQPAP